MRIYSTQSPEYVHSLKATHLYQRQCKHKTTCQESVTKHNTVNRKTTVIFKREAPNPPGIKSDHSQVQVK